MQGGDTVFARHPSLLPTCVPRRRGEDLLAGGISVGLGTVTGMETLRHVVLFVHLIGFAVLFGAWAAQAFGGTRQITRIMDYGLLIAGVAGLALAAPWGIEYELNYVKIGTKLVILLAIGALLGIGSARQKRGQAVPSAMFWLIGILTALNAGIAAIWR